MLPASDSAVPRVQVDDTDLQNGHLPISPTSTLRRILESGPAERNEFRPDPVILDAAITLRLRSEVPQSAHHDPGRGAASPRAAASQADPGA